MSKTISKKLVLLMIALAILCVGFIALSGTFATQVSYDSEMKELSEKDFYVDLMHLSGDTYTTLLGDGSQAFPDSSFWCPGRSEILYLKVVNNEAFPVDCTLTLDVNNSGFDDVLRYAVINDQLIPGDHSHPTSWTEFVSRTDGAKVLKEAVHEIMPQTLLAPNSEVYLALCIHMDENASSDYQNKTLLMNFALRTNANYQPGDIPASSN